jgi:hypothetical protein
MENKTALQFQSNREKRAQTDYSRRRRELFRLVSAEQGVREKEIRTVMEQSGTS